jgi:lysine 2,3-aminomutase
MPIRRKPIGSYDILGTEVINNDVFQDRFDVHPRGIKKILKTDLPELWLSNPDIYEILKSAEGVGAARMALYEYLNKCEDKVFREDNDYHVLEKATIRECVRAFKSIIGAINEKRTKTSALSYLLRLAQGASPTDIPELSRDFLVEFIHLFRGVAGLSGIYSVYGIPEKRSIPAFIAQDGREAALSRSDFLDKMAVEAEKKMRKYPTGLEKSVIEKRQKNRARILKVYGAAESDWQDYGWHLKHVIKSAGELAKMIDLTDDEKKAIQIAEKFRVPFGITPYYVSLMDKEPGRKYDSAVRAQVIPPVEYAEFFAKHKAERGEIMDFMGEHDTSPFDLITRRYPEILIIKPYNSCAQICVYCQRNWEIEGVLDRKAVCPKPKIDAAIDWAKRRKSIRDVLITGGDPMVLSDARLDHMLAKLAAIEHVLRIRIGTRIPVVLPFRITDSFISMLAKHVEIGRREICFITHFEHPYEITPEAAQAVTKLRKIGVSVYNQQVYTFETSRRFETVALRRGLRLIGVDPYYTFITKGKEETDYYRVPIARILQERKEEARLFPGLDRTDEPVFNVPRLGKNHLRAWQDHRLVMILPDGRRVYELHPWEKYITPIPPYNYVDVSIHAYLERLKKRGENLDDYRTIWYYY